MPYKGDAADRDFNDNAPAEKPTSENGPRAYDHQFKNKTERPICTPEHPSGRTVKSASSKHELTASQKSRAKAADVTLSRPARAAALKDSLEAAKAGKQNWNSGTKQLEVSREIARRAPGVSKLAAAGPGLCGATSLIASGLKAAEAREKASEAATGVPSAAARDMRQATDVAHGLAQLCRGEFADGIGTINEALSDSELVGAAAETGRAFWREAEEAARRQTGQKGDQNLKDITDSVRGRGKAAEQMEKAIKNRTSINDSSGTQPVSLP